jgi:hypothetical protein
MPLTVSFFLDGQAIPIALCLPGKNVIDGLIHGSSDVLGFMK